MVLEATDVAVHKLPSYLKLFQGSLPTLFWVKGALFRAKSRNSLPFPDKLLLLKSRVGQPESQWKMMIFKRSTFGINQ